jgi:hypothetical protein
MRRTTIITAVGMAALLTGAVTANAVGSTPPSSGHGGVGAHLAGHGYVVQPGARMGIKPIHGATPSSPAGNKLSLHSAAATGVVSPQPKVYLIFWGSQWSSDPAGARPALKAFFKGLHGTKDPWGKILNQYCEGLPVGTTNCGANGTHIMHPQQSGPLAGAWVDNATAAPQHATQAQIAAEAVRGAEHFGNTSQAPNLNAQYVIASATGTHPDGFPNTGFCGWHSSASSADGRLAFTNLPYLPDLGAGACTTIGSPTLLDGYFSTETHEYAETVTDFFPSAGWLGGGGEIGDECVQLDAREVLNTGTFDVQGLWSNSAGKCVTAGP